MSRLHVMDAEETDCAQLARTMRLPDREEVAAASGKTPLDALLTGLRTSESVSAVRCGGQAIAVFGVVPLGPRVGAPWLLGSDAILAHWFEFARRSREELERVRAPYTILWNCVDDRNQLHRRWLGWLGFDETELIPRYGVGQLPFWRVELCVTR